MNLSPGASGVDRRLQRRSIDDDVNAAIDVDVGAGREVGKVAEARPSYRTYRARPRNLSVVMTQD